MSKKCGSRCAHGMYVVVIATVLLTLAPFTLADQVTKLTANDASTGQRFGVSVAMNGNIAVIGAQGGNSAYLFNTLTGNQTAKLTTSDVVTSLQFGRSVTIQNNQVLVGAIGGNGAAYLFDVTGGNELYKFTASDAADGDNFGGSVAMDGNIAIIGASQNDDGGFASGSAYLFNMTTRTQMAKLIARDDETYDYFGGSVDISGNIAIVGSIGGHSIHPWAGAAYLFDMNGNQLAKLTANDAVNWDLFGTSVAIEDNIALIGAYGDDSYAGSAYLFDVTTKQQIAKFTANDREADDRFGGSVAICGDIAIIGAWGDNDNTGAVYLFDIPTRTQIAKLTAYDGQTEDYFGWSVGMDGNKVIVGAYGDDDGGIQAGAAYLFTIPEPMTLGLLAMGGLGLLMRKRK